MIDPYLLLHVNKETNENELKENFKYLSKICHPDNGGTYEDMKVLYSSYLFIKDKEKYSFEFYDKKKFPSLFEIVTDGYNQKFNDEFLQSNVTMLENDVDIGTDIQKAFTIEKMEYKENNKDFHQRLEELKKERKKYS